MSDADAERAAKAARAKAMARTYTPRLFFTLTRRPAQEAPAAEGRPRWQPCERGRARRHSQPHSLQRAFRGPRRPQRGGGRRAGARTVSSRCTRCPSPLTRAHHSPPPTLSTPPPRNVRSPVQSPPATDDSAELRNLVRSQQQTINLLVSEKSSLAASLDRLNGVEAGEQTLCDGTNDAC